MVATIFVLRLSVAIAPQRTDVLLRNDEKIVRPDDDYAAPSP
jgi:hypothetical protein